MSERRVLVVPEGALAGEIELAITYFRACNPGRDLTGTDRAEFARLIAGMLAERAAQELSGMQVITGA